MDALSHTAVATLDSMFRHYDVLHYHAVGPSLFCGLPHLIGRKTVAHVHALDWQRAKWGGAARRVLQAGEWAAAHLPDRTLAISHGICDYLAERHGRQAFYVPTGVNVNDPPEVQSIAGLGLQGDDYVLFLGRLVPEKGCHYLLEAFSQIDTDARLVIAGGGSHSDSYAVGLEALAATDPRVILTGYVSGRLMEELLAHCLVYALPSDLEGLPHSLLQAMSYERCCLVSDIPSCMEALGGAGYSFPAGSVSALQDALTTLLGDGKLRLARGHDARARVIDNYSWEHVVDSLEAHYDAVCRE
jgi:glycosyltransferase involved in cell wall biosynthesis